MSHYSYHLINLNSAVLGALDMGCTWVWSGASKSQCALECRASSAWGSRSRGYEFEPHGGYRDYLNK